VNLAKTNVALAIAAAVLAIPTWLQLRGEAGTFTDIARIPLLFDGFTADNVGHVNLGQPKAAPPAPDPQNPNAPRVVYDQLHFQRTDRGFQLGPMSGELAGAPVNKDRVENDVFSHLRAIRSDREVLVQPNATPEQLASYGLDEAHAFVVKCSDATGQNVIAHLLIGNDAGKGQTGTEAVRGVFVRKADSSDVVLYEVDKLWRRDVQADQWLDRVLVKLEPTSVQRISIRNTATEGFTVAFEKRDGKASWHAVESPPGRGAPRQTEIESLVQRLQWITVQDYRRPLKAANLVELGLQPPAIELDIAWKDGDRDRTAKFSVGKKVDGKNEYHLATTESQFLVTWPQHMVAQLERDFRAELFDLGPQTPEPPKDAPVEQKDAGKEPPKEGPPK
jgi:hypothetical protein